MTSRARHEAVNVTVRKAELGDVPAVQRVARRAWETAYGDFLDAETIDRAMSEWYGDATVRDRITRDSGLFLVAETDDRVGGYVDASLQNGDAVVGALNVDPDWWREGVGSRLLDRAVGALAERGAERVRARALAANDVGRSFYESRGFTVGSRGEDELFGRTAAAVTYVREL